MHCWCFFYKKKTADAENYSLLNAKKLIVNFIFKKSCLFIISFNTKAKTSLGREILVLAAWF